MWLIVLLAVVGLGLWALQTFASNESVGDSRWPVIPRPVLTEREQVLYQRLVAAFPDQVVLAQVALSQIVAVPMEYPQRQALQNKFFRLVADFVVCRHDFSVIMVVELDDSTHLRADRQDADARKAKAVEDAGLRLMRIGTGTLPTIQALRSQLRVDDPNVVPVIADPTVSPKPSDSERVAVLRPTVSVILVVVLFAGGWVAYSRLIAMPVPAMTRPRLVTAPTTGTSAIPTAAPIASVSAVAQADLPRRQAQRALQAQVTADAEATRKSLAWAVYYKAPKSCDDPPTWAAQVECGNGYIRAKRAFEKEWAERNPGP